MGSLPLESAFAEHPGAEAISHERLVQASQQSDDDFSDPLAVSYAPAAPAITTSAAGFDATHEDRAPAPERAGDPSAGAPTSLVDPNASGPRPLIPSERWVREPDIWDTQISISTTGHYAIQRQKTRPLPRPVRFKRPSRWKGALLLVTLLAIIGATAIGLFELAHFGKQVITPTATATPIATHSATRTVTPPTTKK